MKKYLLLTVILLSIVFNQPAKNINIISEEDYIEPNSNPPIVEEA